MASLCKPASQTQTMQGLTLNGLIPAPKHRYKKQTQPSKSITHRSIYWTDELAISDSSTTLSPYYTALALGATVVCSAGALMQYAEAPPQTEKSISNKAIVTAEQSELSNAVNTPPIAASQTAASFSPRPGINATSCQDDNCQAQGSSEQSITQSQLQPTAEVQFQASTLHKLQSQQAILAHRSDDIAQRQAALVARSEKLTQQFANVTTRLGIHPEDAEQIASLLNTDSTYQANRLNLSGLKTAIAIEYSKPVVNNAQLDVLYSQYAQELEQLHDLAQDVLAQYLVEVSAGLSVPIWQDEEVYSLLRTLMDVAHFRQMQVIEHNVLAQMDAQLNQQRTKLTALVEENSSLMAMDRDQLDQFF
ncbi:MAG: hypothetical protein AAF579_00805 [Cyanobacteria bacterium P01_C01_bin.118]